MKELYIIPDRRRMAESISLAEQYGAHFEYNDFFAPGVLDDPELVEKLIELYRATGRDRSRDTLHGAFLDVTVHSEDALIRHVSRRRVKQSMDVAAELGIRGVVFHTNLIPGFRQQSYLDHWVDANELFWREVLDEYTALEVLIENMFDDSPEQLQALAERMRDCPRFGVCFDYAHAASFGRHCDTERWVSSLLPSTRHMHINDNDLAEDLHLPLGEGRIDWSTFDRRMRAAGADCSVLLEVRGLEAARQSLEYIAGHGYYPLNIGGNKEA